MKKNTVYNFTKMLFILFGIGTIILLLMAYLDLDIDNRIVMKLAGVYILLLFFLLLYVPIITIFNLRKLKWIEIRKRVFKFIALFIISSAINYILDWFFRPSDMDLVRLFTNALAFAFGLSFIDVTLLKKKEDFKF